MSELDTCIAEVARLYPAVYELLHQRWTLHEKRPSPETLAVLQHLARTGPLTVSEAARHFSRALSAVSELVDRIEANGWIARSPDGRDRRRVLLWLTDAGSAVLERAQRVLSAEALSAALARLTPQQREQLVVGLRALVDAARLSLPPRSPP
ncbi:MarR family winged helix-turn-helix transcriptional regulator [Tahibacter caeni]|uniref:MarR family winged helix-turn-helix transcriptional regulator n=1 Tax=Tahibacter caeni TaxID=1453545 RepID=UPI0021476713|nr:MarR family transcriptional regulator [Tahibacter caeni]